MKIFVIVIAALAVVVMIVVRLLRGRLPMEASGQTKTPVPAGKLSEVVAFTINLDVEEKPALFILLGEDGSINRMGKGTAEAAERELFIGKTDPAIFLSVCSHLTKGMLQSLGQGYQMQAPRGASCKLTITVKFKDGSSNGMAFLYGSESNGPPRDVAEFVTTAVAQTDPWYEEFRRNALRREQS
jgi:hypothetical protein